MRYDFDEVIERRGTDCVKWDGVEHVWGRSDLLPMWVADMDFRTPPFVMDALRKRLEHEVLGYTFAGEEWGEAICSWLKRRHQWEVTREMLCYVPGVVRGLAYALQSYTERGDRVMVMTPVYHPFFLVTERLEREVVYSPLELREGQYEIDFARFRRDIAGCKVLILCNPHNPGGRVWTLEELQQIADICKENHTLVFSDEIHADLTLPPYKHHPFATVSDAALHNCVTFMAPSKTFNMPGLSSAFTVIPDAEVRSRFMAYMEAGEFDHGNLLAYVGVAAAFNHGDEWLGQLLDYLQGNIDYVEQYLRTYIPGVKMIRPQASYLVYLDCRDLQLTQEQLVQLFVEKAHLALNDGTMFGEPGRGFMRLNVGCPRSVLDEALRRLEVAVNQSL